MGMPSFMGLDRDQELEAVERADGVPLRRIQQQSSLAKVDGVLVHLGSAEHDVNWDAVIDDVGEERALERFE
jgi:hypothetical protein